jgi:hypothetical protein
MEASNDLRELVRSVGRIEGKLDGFNRLAERVRLLEIWQSWLRGAWAVMAGAWVYVCRK